MGHGLRSALLAVLVVAAMGKTSILFHRLPLRHGLIGGGGAVDQEPGHAPLEDSKWLLPAGLY